MRTAKSIEEQIARFQESVATQLEPHVIVMIVNQEQDELLDFRIEPSGNMTALLALRQASHSLPPSGTLQSGALRRSSHRPDVLTGGQAVQDRPLRQNSKSHHRVNARLNA